MRELGTARQRLTPGALDPPRAPHWSLAPAAPSIHPRTQRPPLRNPRPTHLLVPLGAPRPRIPADLPEPPLTTCGCGWCPGAATLLCRTLPAAGSTCDMPGAPPARPAPPRSLAEERPRRRALHAGRCLPALSRGPHPRAPAPAGRRPPPRPLGLPALPARAAPARRQGFPAPGPRVPESARPSCSHPRPVSSSPRPLAAPRGPKSHPCGGGFPLGPGASWKSRGGLEAREGTRSPPAGGDAAAARAQGDAAQPLGSAGRSRGPQAEQHKWVALRGVISRSHLGTFLGTGPASPSRRSHGLPGLSSRRRVTRAPLSLLPRPTAHPPARRSLGEGQPALPGPGAPQGLAAGAFAPLFSRAAGLWESKRGRAAPRVNSLGVGVGRRRRLS